MKKTIIESIENEAMTRLCSVCDQPMVEGQAFNGLRRAHWDCAKGSPAPEPIFARPQPAITVSKLSLEKAPEGLSRGEPRKPELGPTGTDVRLAATVPGSRQIESRRWVETWRSSANGRTSIGLECPFCFEIVRAFVWSLPNGKRCPCGAFHGRFQSTHWQEEPKPEAST